MNVPFVDLKAQYLSLKSEIDPAIQSVINETAFVGGKYVEGFEKAYAEKYGMKHCISCANGTDAIYITLKALGIGPGDEVITVANSLIATSETITQTGARPVFVDIDEYFHIDPVEDRIEDHQEDQGRHPRPSLRPAGRHQGRQGDLRQAQSPPHRGLRPVPFRHLPAARRRGHSGSPGHSASIPGKNLGAYGDGGAIVTDDDEFARNARAVRQPRLAPEAHPRDRGHQQPPRRHPGRRAPGQAQAYRRLEQGPEQPRPEVQRPPGRRGQIKCPKLRPDTFHIFHLYVIRAERRDDLAAFLKTKGVFTGIHYPTALPLMPAYRYLRHQPSDFPGRLRVPGPDPVPADVSGAHGRADRLRRGFDQGILSGNEGILTASRNV